MIYYEKLRQDIIEGVLKPGEKLTISKLKKTLNVGQCPIREALSQLLATGLVEIEANRGFRVSDVSEEDFQEIVQTVCLIEEVALRKSIQQGNEQWEANIVSALHLLSLVEKSNEKVDYFTWHERNAAFHTALLSGFSNASFLQLRKLAFGKLDRYIRIAVKVKFKPLPVYHQEHAGIAEAALKRDADEACRLLIKHYSDPLEFCIKTLQERKVSI